MQGKVKWFDDARGYGFIRVANSPDVFVHHSVIRMSGHRTLLNGQKVEFDLEQTEKGLNARDVFLVDA